MIGVQPIPQFNPAGSSPTYDLLQNAMMGYQNMVKAAYTQPMAQQSLQQQIADTIMKQAQAKQAEPMEAAKLGQAQAQIPYMQSETAKNNAGIPLLGQQTAEQQIKNQFLPQRESADISKIQAETNMNNAMAQGGGRYATPFQKSYYGLINHLSGTYGYDPATAKQYADAYISGDTQINGKVLPQLTGAGQDFLNQVYKTQAPAAVQTQAAAMDNISQELHNLDINSLKNYTGFSGRSEVAGNALKAALGFKTPEQYQNYVAAKNQTIEGMDTLRKALGTTVVPTYVKKIIGSLTDPSDGVWNNPQTVQAKYDQVLDWVDTYKNNIYSKAKYGVTAPSNFQQSNQQKNINPNQPETAAMIGNNIQNYGNNSQNNNLLPRNTSPDVRNAISNTANNFKSQTIHMVSPDGQEYDVPQGKVQLFLSNGYRRKS